MLALATRTMPSASSGTVSRSDAASSAATASARGAIDRHPAAEEELRIEPAEQQIRVRHGQLGAGAVAHGPGHRPGASRPDAQRAAGVRRRRSIRRRRRRCGCRCTGSRIGKSPMRDSVDVATSPSIRLTSVDVPPMSNGDDAPEPGRPRHRARADHAGGRPDSTVRTACARADAAEIDPPFDCMMASRRRAEAGFERAEVPIDQRRDVRIHDRRAPALELAVLGQHFMRHRHEPARAAQPLGDSPLVRGVAVRVQEADGDDVGAARPQLGAPGDRPRRRQGAASTWPVASSRSATPNVSARLDERPRQRHEDVVELGPRLPADAQDVLEARGRDERDARALALEHGVGRDGRSVDDVGREPKRVRGSLAKSSRDGSYEREADLVAVRIGAGPWSMSRPPVSSRAPVSARAS